MTNNLKFNKLTPNNITIEAEAFLFRAERKLYFYKLKKNFVYRVDKVSKVC